jgi:hypothetical protein
MRNKLRKLFTILRNLDCELQMLGARGDWGIQDTPEFAAETLVAAFSFLTRLKNAPATLLYDATEELLYLHVSRTTPHSESTDWRDHFKTLGQLDEEEQRRDAAFRELVEAYRKAVRP